MIVYLNINKKTYWLITSDYFSQNAKNVTGKTTFFFILFEKVFFDKKIFRILVNVAGKLADDYPYGNTIFTHTGMPNTLKQLATEVVTKVSILVRPYQL